MSHGLPVTAPTLVHLPPHARDGRAARGLFTAEEQASVRTFFAHRPELPATPLRQAPALGASLGLGPLWLKDETSRFDLPAFKGLGVAFAVAHLASEGRLPPGATLVCASEGNHGRAVARAARDQGLASRVYVGSRVAGARVDAIADEGATVVRVAGTYDDAVRAAASDAAAHGSVLVSDTGRPGHDTIPRLIMLGYTRLMDECAEAWGNTPPEVVVAQGGVGGLAGAIAAWVTHREGWRPRLVCVEPLAAACVQRAVRHGSPVRLEGPLDTIMGGLRCGEVSATAYDAVAGMYDAYLAIDDGWAREAMRRLAAPGGSDPPVETCPSGAAGVGALLALAHEPALASVRRALRLASGTRVLALVTEGVTEPDLFKEVMTA